MQIDISIKNKIATLIAKDDYIVCGNTDYTIHFIFDSEWDNETTKTARFKYNNEFIDVVFNGDVCAVPVIKNAIVCEIGVYSGNLQTTTPAYILCKKSILCGDGVPADPVPDVYEQIIEILNNKQNTLIAGNGINISEDNIISAIGGTGTGGVGILSVEQTTTSSEDSGDNIVTVTLTDGTTSTFIVKNGSKGSTGAQGIQGEIGESGYTPIKGIDYFTPTEIKEIEEAAAASVDIPEALPNPYALTFTGAVTGSYDGSQAVTVEIPSGGGGGGESAFRLINTVNITEETSSIKIDKDSDGNAFEISEVLIYFDNTTYATADGTFYFRPLCKSVYNMNCYGFISKTAGVNFQRWIYAKHIANGFWRAEFIMNTGHNVPLYSNPGETITSFELLYPFAAGNIYVYGR